MTLAEYAWVDPDPNRPTSTMPEPRLVVIVEDQPDSFVLWELAADGRHAGDTVHETQKYAKEQALHEFGSRLGDWTETPWSSEEARAKARDLLGVGNAG
jgi:hypothetical protein